MCVADPGQVVAVSDEGTAEVVMRGRSQQVLLAVLPDSGRAVSVGDWLLVQSGLALERIDAVEAAQRRQLLDELRAGAS